MSLIDAIMPPLIVIALVVMAGIPFAAIVGRFLRDKPKPPGPWDRQMTRRLKPGVSKRKGDPVFQEDLEDGE